MLTPFNPLFPIQSLSSEFRGSVNLKEMIDNLSAYSQGYTIRSTNFLTCCGSGRFIVYPLPRKADKLEEICTIVLYLRTVKEASDHKVTFSIKEGSSWRTRVYNLSRFGDRKRHRGHGFYISHQKLRENPVISFSVVLHKDVLISKPLFKNSRTLDYRLEEMHKFSQKTGDITLVLKGKQIEPDLGPPSAKKRKLNASTNQEIKICGAVLRSASSDSVLYRF